MKITHFLTVILCGMLCSFSYKASSQITLRTGLIAEWNFNDSTANDNSGKNLNGAIVGNPKDIYGIMGNAKHFNGSSDRIIVKNNPLISFGLTKKFSISLWYRNDTDNIGAVNERALISKTYGTHSNSDYMLYFENLGTGSQLNWGTGCYSDSAAWMQIKEPKPLIWHHLVVTLKDSFDGTIYYYPKSIYIDGKMVKHDIAPCRLDSVSADLEIAASYNSKDAREHYFYGDMDEIRIYSRVLTQKDVNGLYNLLYTGDEEINNNSKLNLLLYPNPVSDILNIHLPDNNKYRIIITDINGREFINKPINSSNEIDISSMPNGIYSVRYISAEKVVNKTIVIYHR